MRGAPQRITETGSSLKQSGRQTISQGKGGLLTIIKVHLGSAENLVILMALPSQDHQITWAGSGNGCCDGQGPIGNHLKSRTSRD